MKNHRNRSALGNKNIVGNAGKGLNLVFSKYNTETGRHEVIDMESLKRIELQAYSPRGRKQRKTDERPRPDLPASAPVNRTKKQINLSLKQELLDAVNGAAKERNVDRNSLIEHAIKLYLDIK